MKPSCTAIMIAAWLLTGQAVPGNGAEMPNSTIKGDASADAFTVVLLPDTQYYSKNDPDTYYAQTGAIASPKSSTLLREMYNGHRPKMVIHLGDITNDGDSEDQWEVASKAHAVLEDAGIPYTVIPGNHDYQGDGDAGERYKRRNSKNYNLHFGPLLRFQGKSWYGGHFGPCTYPKSGTHTPLYCRNDNNYAFFEAGDLEFMVVNLEYAPRPEVLCWANALIRDYPTRRVIVVTHGYLDHHGILKTDCGADTVWNELARRHSNVFLVLCGHEGDSELKPDKGAAKNPVYAILTDYQCEAGKGYDNHGNGWLRTLRFVPSEGKGKIHVKTFSVLDGVDRFNYILHDCPIHEKVELVYDALDPENACHSYTLEYDMTTPTSYEYSAYGVCDPVFYQPAGTLRVEAGRTFTILADAKLIFGDGTRIVVQGKITAIGTDKMPIYVSKADGPLSAFNREHRIKVSSPLSITGGGGVIRLR